MLKRFKEWLELKSKLHAHMPKPPLVKERDMWWVSFGENVGSEMNGKSTLFSRPCIIIKKLAHGFYMVAPSTSKIHVGSWYAKITLGGKDNYICLNQIRTIDHRRLSSRLGRVDEADFKNVKRAFWELYK